MASECLFCGSPFIPKRTGQRFCNPSCSRSYTARAEGKQPKVEMTCPVCGKVFMEYQSNVKGAAKYCSRSCGAKGRHLGKSLPLCAICGQPVRTMRNAYCSKSCSNKARWIGAKTTPDKQRRDTAGQLARQLNGSQPEACSWCGKAAKLVKHHPDYAKPLEVVWLCRVCHAAIHQFPQPCLSPRRQAAATP